MKTLPSSAGRLDDCGGPSISMASAQDGMLIEFEKIEKGPEIFISWVSIQSLDS